MDILGTIFIIAITLESLVEYFNVVTTTRPLPWKMVVAIVLGVALALLANIDLYEMVGVVFLWPVVGQILTGLVLSRGANYVADFVKLITTKAKV